MKKKLISIFAVFTIIGTLSTSCGKDEKTNGVKKMKTLLAKGGRSAVLFEYSTAKEAVQFAQSGLIDKVFELQRESQSVADVVTVNATIDFTNGEAVLKDYAFVDSKGSYIRHYVFNTNAGQYETFSGGPAPATCPHGTTFIGRCSQLSTLYTCMSSKIAVWALAKFDNSVSSIGHGTTVTFIGAGTGTITACGGTF